MFLFNNNMLFSQMAVNNDGSPPDNAAMLDVKSSYRGFLLPRLSDGARNSIPAPVNGLLIYNTTTDLVNYFNGIYWYQVECYASSASAGSFKPGGGVSINADPDNPPDSSAMLDINDPGRGVLIPRTVQASITAPSTGLIIYNITTNLINYYNGSEWKEICAISTGITVASNTSGFTGIGAGFIDISASEPSQGLYTHNYIWSSTQYLTSYARRRLLLYFNAKSNPYYDLKWLGLQIRCVKD